MNVNELNVTFNTYGVDEVVNKLSMVAEKLNEVNSLIKDISSSDIQINFNVGDNPMDLSRYTAEKFKKQNKSIIKAFSTKELVGELAKRTGVEKIEVERDETHFLATRGPAIVLQIID